LFEKANEECNVNVQMWGSICFIWHNEGVSLWVKIPWIVVSWKVDWFGG